MDSPSSHTRIYQRVSVRLLPILFSCYLINYIDRVNVSFAKLTMSASLGISDLAYGFGAGLFFLGYISCQIPSNLLLQRFGARRWIALLLLVWGVISASTAFIQTGWQFYAIRFVLGAAEAGFFPGVILYLTWWYPSSMRARIIALFLTAIPVAGVLGGPLSGWIMQTTQGLGLEGWRWLFLLEGIPCLGLALWVFRGLPDHPRDAAWLEENDREQLESLLIREAVERTQGGAPDHVSAIFRMPVIWLLCVLYFCSMMGLYGLSFWLPQIINDLGWKGPLQIGLISAVPWFFAVIFMLAWGASSDHRQERILHAAAAAAMAGIGFLLCGAVQYNWGGLAAACVAASGVLGLLAVQWTIPGTLLNGTAAAAGIAFINSCGNLGGFLSPTLIGWVTTRTHSNASGQYITGAFLFLAAILFLFLHLLQDDGRRQSAEKNRT